MMNVLDVECLLFLLLENSIAIFLLFVYLNYIICCCFLSYLSILFSFISIGFISFVSLFFLLVCFVWCHTYTFTQDHDLASHTTYVMCINFYTWVMGLLQFNIDAERQIFPNFFFMAILFTLRVFVRNLLEGSPRGNMFISSFRCLMLHSIHFCNSMHTHSFAFMSFN